MVKALIQPDLWNPSDTIAYLKGMRLSHSMPRLGGTQTYWTPIGCFMRCGRALVPPVDLGVYAINEACALNRGVGEPPREWAHWTGVFTYPFLMATSNTCGTTPRRFSRSTACCSISTDRGAHMIMLYLLSGGDWVFAVLAATTSVPVASTTRWRPSSSRRAWSGSPAAAAGDVARGVSLRRYGLVDAAH